MAEEWVNRGLGYDQHEGKDGSRKAEGKAGFLASGEGAFAPASGGEIAQAVRVPEYDERDEGEDGGNGHEWESDDVGVKFGGLEGGGKSGDSEKNLCRTAGDEDGAGPLDDSASHRCNGEQDRGSLGGVVFSDSGFLVWFGY